MYNTSLNQWIVFLDFAIGDFLKPHYTAKVVRFVMVLVADNDFKLNYDAMGATRDNYVTKGEEHYGVSVISHAHLHKRNQPHFRSGRLCGISVESLPRMREVAGLILGRVIPISFKMVVADLF